MNALVEEWKARGRWVTALGLRVFCIRAGEGPDLVCFHGFPSCSFDWHRLLPLLGAHRRVLVLDFPGLGLSEKPPDYSYSLVAQFDVVEELLRGEGVSTFDLVCHDMGETVGCELFYRQERGETPLRARRAIFLNGSVYMDLHHPLPAQRLIRSPRFGPVLARLGTRRLFEWQFRRLFARRDTLSAQELEAYWEMSNSNGGRRVLAKVAQYMNERRAREARWTGPLTRLALPLLILWGQDDPVSVPAIAERLHRTVPGSRLEWLPGVGHYPQLEAAEQVAERINAFLE